MVTPRGESERLPDPDELSRLLKMVLDSGEFDTEADARRYFDSFRLQIVLGDDAVEDPAVHPAIVTAVNTATRAFLGGVTVIATTDSPCQAAWHRGQSVVEACAQLGATIGTASDLEEFTPAVVFGTPYIPVVGSPLLYAMAWGWVACVSDRRISRTGRVAPVPPASMVAGALAVSEAFQARRGDVFAGRRTAGVSLWRPDIKFTAPAAIGPPLAYVFREAWLLGLGHLGQAYAWGIGLLPLPADMRLMLQDTDRIKKPNLDTSLLASATDLGKFKTRVVERRFAQIGVEALLCERLLDAQQRVQGNEPRLAFVGLDKPEPRRVLDGCGYTRVIDLGLGAGPRDYLGIDLHLLGGQRRAVDIFAAPPNAADRRGYRLIDSQPAYQRLTREHERCGVLRIATRTVATSFVGAVAAALGIADALRSLHGGKDLDVVSLTLANPATISTSPAVDCDVTRMPPLRAAGLLGLACEPGGLHASVYDRISVGCIAVQ